MKIRRQMPQVKIERQARLPLKRQMAKAQSKHSLHKLEKVVL